MELFWKEKPPSYNRRKKAGNELQHCGNGREGNGQELIQSNSTSCPKHKLGEETNKDQTKQNKTSERPTGQPFPSRPPRGYSKNTGIQKKKKKTKTNNMELNDLTKIFVGEKLKFLMEEFQFTKSLKI